MHSKALTLEAVFVALPLLKGKEEEMLRQKKHLAEVAQLVADGVIELVIEEHVPRQIDALNAAYQTFDQRSHFGKVSITT